MKRTIVIKCMFPPLSQHQRRGDPTVPSPLRGWRRHECRFGANEVRSGRLTERESRSGERIQLRVRKEPRTRGGVCECACRSNGGVGVGARSSARHPQEQRRVRSIANKLGQISCGFGRNKFRSLGEPSRGRTKGKEPPMSSCRQRWPWGGTSKSKAQYGKG